MNFDEVINRKNTASIKWDLMKEFNKPDDVIPLWVADMDFKVHEPILKALHDRVSHGIFGYTAATDDYYDSIINWMKRRHNWCIKKEWILNIPGVIPALNFIIQCLTNKGDGILIQRPVYRPFSQAILNNDRALINSPLILKENHYEIDFSDFEAKIKQHHVKLFILCSPHNPVGRVWTKDELTKMGDICLKHHVLIVVDEIHHDIVFKHIKHIPFASLGEKYSNQCITCTAPSKTFNLASLKISNMIIEKKEIREKLYNYQEKIGITGVNVFGLTASLAAYNTGDEWLESIIDYIYENKQYVENFIKERLPKIKMIESEGTYLVWLDFRACGMDQDRLEKFLLEEAKIWFNDGSTFGDEGILFQRMNIACPRVILEKALIKLEKAFNKIN